MSEKEILNNNNNNYNNNNNNNNNDYIKIKDLKDKEILGIKKTFIRDFNYKNFYEFLIKYLTPNEEKEIKLSVRDQYNDYLEVIEENFNDYNNNIESYNNEFFIDFSEEIFHSLIQTVNFPKENLEEKKVNLFFN